MMQLQPRTGTSLGFSERAERVLAYLVPILSGLFFLVVERNRSVRRHAMQSIMIFVPILLGYFILSFLSGIWVIGILFGIAALLVKWIGITLWVLLMLAAFMTDAVFVQPRRRGI